MKTYIISGASGLNHAPLRKILNDAGMKEINIIDKHNKIITYTDFVFIEQGYTNTAIGWMYDKRTYNIKCNLKSLLNDYKTVITNKSNLYKNMLTTNNYITNNYMAETWDTNLTEKNNTAKYPLIIRPVGMGASSGIGVSVVENISQLNDAVTNLKKDGFKEIIASKYINNILLTDDGKKFHLRMYLFICIGKDDYFSYDIWEEGKILTAGLPYKNEDFGNRLIHDTHAGTTPKNTYYPQDLPAKGDKNELNLHMRLIVDNVAKIMKNKNNILPEANYCYQVFGCDFLPTVDNKVILMEINNKVGFEPCGDLTGWNPKTGPWTDDYTDFSRKYYEWIYTNIRDVC